MYKVCSKQNEYWYIFRSISYKFRTRFRFGVQFTVGQSIDCNRSEKERGEKIPFLKCIVFDSLSNMTTEILVWWSLCAPADVITAAGLLHVINKQHGQNFRMKTRMRHVFGLTIFIKSILEHTNTRANRRVSCEQAFQWQLHFSTE